MKEYKYLLWDIDGTVMDFLAAERAAIKTLFVKFNLGECTDEMLKRYSAINVRYWKALERGEKTKPQILVERFREFFEGEGINPALAESFNEEYQVTLGDTVVIRDNSDILLSELKGKYILAAVTNGTKVAQEKKLKTSGFDKVFDYIFISEIVGAEKPNKQFFDVVFESMNINVNDISRTNISANDFAKDSLLEEKSKFLIIGDSLTSDIRGGINAGIDTCWYNPNGDVNNSEMVPTYIISNLNELKNILQE